MAGVGRLRSSRRLWAVVAVVLMAAAALVLWRSSGSGTAQPDNRRAGSLLGSVDWNEPVLLPDGHSVMVYADVMHLPHDYCLGEGLPTLRPTVTETAGSVTIQVRAYRPRDKPLVDNCALLGYEPVPVTARLSQPLGRRSLHDAKGDTVPVLDAAKVPAPSYLPAGYQPTALGGTPSTGSYRYYEHLPEPGDGNQLDLRIFQRLLPIQPLSEQQTVLRGTVLGHPAEVVQSGGSIAVQRCAVWTERPYVWSICSYGVPLLSAEQLLRIGNSLRLG